MERCFRSISSVLFSSERRGVKASLFFTAYCVINNCLLYLTKQNIGNMRTSTLTVKEIRNLGIKTDDVLDYEFIWMNNENVYFLIVNGKRAVAFSDYNARTKSFYKIKKMNLGLGWLELQLPNEEQ